MVANARQLGGNIDILAAFGGVIAAAAAWTIWGGDMFPKEADPKGDPETWTREEMRRWLAAVRFSSVEGPDVVASLTGLTEGPFPA